MRIYSRFYSYHEVYKNMSWNSSVGIATGYEAAWPGFESWYGQDLSLLHDVQTGSGVHPASYPTGEVKLPCVEWIKHHALKTNGATEIELYNTGEWSASIPGSYLILGSNFDIQVLYLYSCEVPLERTNEGKKKEISECQRLPLLEKLKVHLRGASSLKENFYFFFSSLSLFDHVAQ
jgi:hypothetical protein